MDNIMYCRDLNVLSTSSIYSHVILNAFMENSYYYRYPEGLGKHGSEVANRIGVRPLCGKMGRICIKYVVLHPLLVYSLNQDYNCSLFNHCVLDL